MAEICGPVLAFEMAANTGNTLIYGTGFGSQEN